MDQTDITIWLNDHKDEIIFTPDELLSEADYLAYQQFEIRRLFEDIIDYDLTGALTVYRDPEYKYDSKDHCYCCGYFEPNEYNKARYGFCSKFGKELNPRTYSCDVMIIL